MYQFNFHAVAPFVSHLISVAVGFFVIVKNPRSSLHVTLGIFCLFASLWQFGTGMMFMAKTDELAIFWDRIVYIGVNFMWMMHFHFSLLFSKADDKKYWLVAAYIIATFYALFIFSDYLIHDLYRYAWGCHTIAGPLHHSFVLISTGFYMKSLYLIFRSYKRTGNLREKAQYKYYFVGFAIYVSATLAYLPAYEISIYPFSYWFETIYCLILVYIIIKHRMLDIETVVHKTLLWVTTSTISLVPAALFLLFSYTFLIQMPQMLFILSIMGVVTSVIILYAIVQPRIDVIFERRKYNYRIILREFMEKVVTLHDREKLVRLTEETLKKALYARTVRCLLMNKEGWLEAASGAGHSFPIKPDQTLMDHIVSTNDILEHDFVFSDPIHEKFRAPLKDFFDLTGAYIAVPIVHEHQAQGVILLDKKSTLHAYSEVDKQFLKELTVGISFAIINSQMFETQTELLEKEKEARQIQEELVLVKDTMNKELESKVEERTRELKRAMQELESTNSVLTDTRDALWGEMVLAKKIQTILLPKKPTIHGYEITAYMAPADEVGGDYYDVINTNGRDWIVIGDVSGHGVSSGLVMMMAQTAIHTALERNSRISPQALLSTINESLSKNIQQMSEDKYMTMTVLAAHEAGQFTFSGLHQDIIVYRRDTNAIELVKTQGVWIGIHSPIDDMLSDANLELAMGDAMLLYTDGVTEARRKPSLKREKEPELHMFGDEKLQELFAGLANGSVEEVKSAILNALAEYECKDDVTFMIIRRVAT